MLARIAVLMLGSSLLISGCGGDGPVGPPDPPAVVSVTVSGPTSIEEGKTAQLSASAWDASGNALSDRSFTWTSSNEAVATVSAGLISAKAAGPVTITATTADKSGKLEMVVTVIPIASLVVSPDTATRTVGDSVKLSATARDGSGNVLTGRQVVWTSGDTTKAKVSGAGMVTAFGAGTATITATAEGRTGHATITITAAPAIGFSQNSVSLNTQVGQSASQTVNVTNAGGGTLTGLEGAVLYQSGQPSGWLRAELNGTAAPATLTLTANAANLAAGTYNATVVIRSTVPGVAERSVAVTFAVAQVPIATLALVPDSASIMVGDTVRLRAIARDAGSNELLGRPVTISSSDTTVARVSTSGLVTGVAPGSATITAVSEGVSATAKIVVRPLPTAPSIILAATSVSLSAQTGQSASSTVSVTNGGDLPLTGLSATSSAPWLAAALSSTSAPATLTLSASAATLQPGTYTAAVTIRSSLTGVSEKVVSVTLTVSSPPVSPSAVLVGAGDIAHCGSQGDEATAALLDGIAGTVITLGDNAYEHGTLAEYNNCYQPSWGRHKARTRPAVGNHEYVTPGASGYFDYYGGGAGQGLLQLRCR
jgi:uncharacterized protein YjdB